MEKIRNLSLRKSIIVYMLTGIVIGFILGAFIGLEAEQAQEQIWWKYVDQDQYIEEMQKRDPDAFDVAIPRISNDDMSRTDARLSELCDFLTTYGILVLCAAGIVVSTCLFYRNKIRKPLLELNLAARKIADNDLDFEIGYQSKDELGVLCREFEHMKEELAQNNQKMWRMVEDEQVLRSAIAHDLRTPLTVLKGYQEMMMEFIPEEKLDREALLDILTESREQVERLERFLYRMRVFSALEREPLSCMDMSVDEIAEQIEKTGKMLAETSEKQFEVFTGGEGEKLTLDQDLILEVAENLITNALRYAASKVSAGIYQEADRLVLEIKDDGTGFTISEEEAKQAFTSANPRDDLKHFGLGMYISEVCCKKHGGYLEVENQRDGACVRAYFGSCLEMKSGRQ